MRVLDIKRLVQYEETAGDSAASWQVQGLWDRYKNQVHNDRDAATLSSAMRSLQDCYLRTLHALLREGEARFLSTLLRPDFAFYKHRFVNLDPATFKYDHVVTEPVDVPLRRSLARRSVRIAFDELQNYAEKEFSDRRLATLYADTCESVAREVVSVARGLPKSSLDAEWHAALMIEDRTQREVRIGQLLGMSDSLAAAKDLRLGDYLRHAFKSLGNGTTLELTR